jgi:hypothetical protein
VKISASGRYPRIRPDPKPVPRSPPCPQAFAEPSTSTVDSAPSAERFGLSADQHGAIDAFRRYVAAYGELPTFKQLTEDLPTSWTIRQLFGSWNGYQETAGFTPRPTESGTTPALSPQ